VAWRMVDIGTAMAAARAERADRQKNKDGDKKSRSGRNHGIESFDPVKHVSKERADMFSMWLVILFAIVVGLMMRYAVMPAFEGSDGDLLWVLPMSLVFLIPSLHRLVMPEELLEHYGKGTWFKASFLLVFGWLAITFLLSNPPFGDIGAPEAAAAWTVVVVDGEDLIMTHDDLDGGDEMEFHLAEGQSSLNGDVWLLFGLRDNMDTSKATVSGTITLFDGSVHNLSTNSSHFANLSEWGEAMKDTDSNLSWPTMLPHTEDVGTAIRLSTEGLGIGAHTIKVTFEEDGDPWHNSRSYTWKVIVKEYTPPPVE